MGMDLTVTLPADRVPRGPALAQFVAEHGCPLKLAMIDGELAFPDETPPEAWRELRVAVPGGMVTLRRVDNGVSLVTWGNADADLLRVWRTLTWAVAVLSDGRVDGASADAFGRSVGLFPES